jgi:hypothetical protein
MRGLTPDQVEQALLADEAIIAAARGRQMANLALADQMQLPLADGCRSLKEWAAGRLDVSAETAYRLASTARRIQDAPDIARALEKGEVTFDRAEAMSKIPAEGRADWLLGLDIQSLRRIAARHRQLTRSDDHHSHALSELTLQPNLDESRWNIWVSSMATRAPWSTKRSPNSPTRSARCRMAPAQVSDIERLRR